jgi:hypothetical protein
MKENLIRGVVQARTIEAAKDKIHEKMVVIAQNMGSPIMGHHFDNPITEEDWQNFFNADADWSRPAEEDLSGNLPKLGFVYDSLKLGVNFEIVVMVKEVKNLTTGLKDLDKPSEIRCSYRGYRVYHEEDGVIKCFAPFPEWRTHLEKLYKKATGKDTDRRERNREEEKQIKKKATKKALQNLRRLWGI